MTKEITGLGEKFDCSECNPPMLIFCNKHDKIKKIVKHPGRRSLMKSISIFLMVEWKILETQLNPLLPTK